MRLIHHFVPGVGENAPLCVLVHGRAFDMFAMRVFERALPPFSHRLYVQAPFEDPKGGFCWWDMSVEQDPFDGVTALESFLLHDLPGIVKSSGVSHQTAIFGYGFSQGAATLSGFIQQHPTFFRRVALLAGFVLEVESVPSDYAREDRFTAIPRTAVLMIHGTEDDIIPLHRAHDGAKLLRLRGFDVEVMENNVGHKIGVDGMRRLTAWGSE
jgi:phospholipase/carboxylesterase